jgi:hypothetical protein
MPLLLSYLTDLLLVSASLGAAAYCMVLSRRLSRLGSFDDGIGSAIAVLSAQVEEMKAALGEAKAGSDGAGRQLNDLVRQAQEISAELEMMIAACHDFAETAIQVQNGPSAGNGGAPERAADDAFMATDRLVEMPLGQQAATIEDANDGDELSAAMPVFGTRRNPTPETDGENAVPMFRHRAGTGA